MGPRGPPPLRIRKPPSGHTGTNGGGWGGEGGGGRHGAVQKSRSPAEALPAARCSSRIPPSPQRGLKPKGLLRELSGSLRVLPARHAPARGLPGLTTPPRALYPRSRSSVPASRPPYGALSAIWAPPSWRAPPLRYALPPRPAPTPQPPPLPPNPLYPPTPLPHGERRHFAGRVENRNKRIEGETLLSINKECVVKK